MAVAERETWTMSRSISRYNKPCLFSKTASDDHFLSENLFLLIKTHFWSLRSFGKLNFGFSTLEMHIFGPLRYHFGIFHLKSNLSFYRCWRFRSRHDPFASQTRFCPAERFIAVFWIDTNINHVFRIFSLKVIITTHFYLNYILIFTNPVLSLP